MTATQRTRGGLWTRRAALAGLDAAPDRRSGAEFVIMAADQATAPEPRHRPAPPVQGG